MTKIRIGINGMGRIGQTICRVIADYFEDRFEIVAVNDLLPAESLAASLQRDSTHGFFPVEVKSHDSHTLQMGNYAVRVYAEKDAAQIPWGELNVDVVLECTRFYLTTEKNTAHLRAGAKRVIMSAPPKDQTPLFVVGVNDETIADDLQILSNASCTTNCLAPITKALDDAYGVVSGLVSTTHAATSDQSLVDRIGSAKDRAALNNIIPTSTGAARAIGSVLPHLDGRLNGSALRVPVLDGSVLEAVFVVNGERSADEINQMLMSAGEVQNRRSLSGSVLYVGDRYQVSADVIGAPWSSMVLAESTMVIPFGAYTQVKLTAFYDNEIGYVNRMLDLAANLMPPSQ